MIDIDLFRDSTGQAIANALSVIAEAQAKNIDITSWKTVSDLVRQGLGPKVFPIGTQLRVESTAYGEIVWDVVAHNYGKVPRNPDRPTMTLRMHNADITSTQFDNTEALYYAASGLTAGTYHFALLSGYDTTYGGGKNIQFTLTQPVPPGGVIMFPWGYNTQSTATKISTYSSGTETSAIETVSVSEGTDGIDLGTADGKTEHMNHTHRIRYGSNNWAQSAVRQFLNSAKAAGTYWKPQTEFDRLPAWAASKAGFMSTLPQEFLDAVVACEHITATNTVYETGMELNTTYTTTEKFYLPSMTELGYGNNNGHAEGSVYPYFNGATNADRIAYAKSGAAQYYWLRSPTPSNAGGVRPVGPSGALCHDIAYSSYAVLAACEIG